MSMNFFIMTSTTQDGHTEYGKTEYVIVGQDKAGRRFRLDTSVLYNDDKTDRECRDIQNRRIMRMLQSIAYGQKIDMQFWKEIEPAYESEAFYKLDTKQRMKIEQEHVDMYGV
ncbi:hypothetical protein GAP32_040 [Cronobacter phage vB_CsaM_GAP32]|uniref:Uncharacterized protein n=1 Tax=Cronobacter phage vB_CsaM_GAP32 TaxID=1141136 RepID=K4F753_9CAUD|nr:hypothetical protein GAP32_040 [Cronobacter phage vB_CsaM_GAP32]AFC21487.1 hypothetical protein GAP32_040 [Cronobacter phage vB_CsaM_GAP32]